MKKLKKIFESIFIAYDPFKPIFQDWIKKKTVLYPTQGFHLTEDQFHALIKTIKETGESSLYIAVTELGFREEDLEDFNLEKIHSRELPCSVSYEEYRSIIFFLENGLFSTKGTWGVIVSHEDHAVIGGTDEFMAAFEKNYPAHQQEFRELIDDYIELRQTYFGGDYSPFIPFLDHINPDWRLLDSKWRDVK